MFIAYDETKDVQARMNNKENQTYISIIYFSHQFHYF